jgi:hypothetical protein
MEFEFKCPTCGEIHRGMPSFGYDKPLSYYGAVIVGLTNASLMENGSSFVVALRFRSVAKQSHLYGEPGSH